MSNNRKNILISNSLYPEPHRVFSIKPLSVEAIKDDCIFVLDTNVLLVPYNTGSQSFVEIKRVFETLKKRNRLKIPGQVAREFANNRPKKLATVLQQLSINNSKVTKVELDSYPIFENEKEYKDLLRKKEEINNQIKEFQKSIAGLMSKVKEWQWDDPVSSFYRDLITKKEIVDLEIDHAEASASDYKKADLEKILEERYEHGVPPGFKDKAKDDGGIGDLLIWFTILKIAKSKKHVIFVSGDEKNDWFHRSENQSLFPRFELTMEFDHHSDGRTFHIIKLSELLSLFDAKEATVDEVKGREMKNYSINIRWDEMKDIKVNMSFEDVRMHAVFEWWRKKYGVSPDDVKFQSERHITGVTKNGQKIALRFLFFHANDAYYSMGMQIAAERIIIGGEIMLFDHYDLVILSDEATEDFIRLSREDFSGISRRYKMDATFGLLVDNQFVEV